MPERYLGRSLGKYRVEELIGSGGFAWVFRGYDPELEIPVAIKVLKPQFAGDASFEERFRREASTAAKLRHPNIVKIYSVGRDGEAVYFVMDYLPTGLADKLEHTRTLPEEFVIRVGIDVARALGFAHREGVIHRDIKVDNILFDVHGNAVVADFGIARAVTGYTQQTGTNMVVGTPQYFAPEQARAKPLDGRADIYSLGVSLFRSATGRLPFEGDDWYEIARQHVEEPPPAPRSIVPTLSPEFDNIVLRCLAKHPDDRPATGEELADELTVVLERRRNGSVGASRTMAVSASGDPTVVASVTGGKRAAPIPKRILIPSAFVVLTLALLAIPLFAWLRPSVVGREPARLEPQTVQPPLVVGGDSLKGKSTPPESVGAPTTRRDSLGRPLPARLTITAPPDAKIFVNGVHVTDGTWRADTLRGDTYVVAAVVDAPDGCESAQAEKTIRVRAGQAQEHRLQPRSCGTMILDGQPDGALYRVISADGEVVREGTSAGQVSLLLPIGRYTVTATKPQCAEFEEEQVEVRSGEVRRVTYRMLCG